VKITINNTKMIETQGGLSLLETLTRNSIAIPTACGGRGICGYCRLKVTEGGGPVMPAEKTHLSAKQIEDGMRLSCQIKVQNDLSIEIPEKRLTVKEYTCRCVRIRKLTRDVREFRLKLENPPAIACEPGQYIQLLCPAYDGNEEVSRAYSMASDPQDKGAIELVIRFVPGGICTTWCFEHLKEGDPVRIDGPYGDFHLSDTNRPAVFVAGGSGIAPIRCMLHHMKNFRSKREAVFFFGANLAKDLFYLDLMKDFENSLAHFRFVPVVATPAHDEEWAGETGLVTEALERNITDAADSEAYLCGSPGMIDATIRVLSQLGMPEDRIYYDKFA
jgi:Na+-transporting NADH:ubiquinone oxidoreductase subunit F